MKTQESVNMNNENTNIQIIGEYTLDLTELEKSTRFHQMQEHIFFLTKGGQIKLSNLQLEAINNRFSF